jgi:uncharacterized membrane protein YbhN (UPF0104 family)
VKSAAIRSAAITVRWLVTFAAIWLIARQLDWPSLLGLLAHARIGGLALAGVVAVGQFAIIVWRWQCVIGLIGCGHVAAGPVAAVLGRSLLIGQPLPSIVGGDVVRVASLSSHVGMACAARSVLCDRIIALAALLEMGVAVLPLLAWRVGFGPAFGPVAVVSIGSLAAFTVVLAFPRSWSWLPWFKDHVGIIASDLRTVFQSGLKGYLVIVLAFGTHLSGVLLMYTIAHALAVPISILDCFAILTPALLISAIPFSLGGWGLREGAIAAGFVMIGLTSESGVATSILFGLTGPLLGLATELANLLLRLREKLR